MPRKKPQVLPRISPSSSIRHESKRVSPAFQSVSTSHGPDISSLSEEDVRNLSQFVDNSLDMPSIFGAHAESQTAEWAVQDPDEIIHEVKQRVQIRKPWRKELNDEVLERSQQRERQNRIDRGYHIILPDNRVRTMEDQLSRRVRAQLLGEPLPEPTTAVPSSAHGRRQEESKGPKKFRNPWYLQPADWFSKQAAKDSAEGVGGGFPYDGQILNTEGVYGKGVVDPNIPEGEPRPLTHKEKETFLSVQAFKKHLQGQRLPHFLQ